MNLNICNLKGSEFSEKQKRAALWRLICSGLRRDQTACTPHRHQTSAASLSSQSLILISLLVSEIWSGSECCQAAARARARYQVTALSVHLAAADPDRTEELEPGPKLSPARLQFNVITATMLHACFSSLFHLL